MWDAAEPGILEIFTHKEVIARFRHVTYGMEGAGLPAKKKFITAWMADINKATCQRMGVYMTLPFGPVMDTESGFMNFNVFPGFRAASLAGVNDGDVEALVEPIVRHVHVWIAGRHAGRTKWFIDWLANILQHPHNKHKTGLVVNGEMQYAKGILPGFFRECVLGTDCSFQTSSVRDSVFARFASGVKSVVFLQLDEELHGMDEPIPRRCSTDRGQLNGLITEDYITHEERYKNRVTIKNLVNLYMTTDHTTEADISWKYALFEAGRMEEDGDVAYLDGLRAHLARPEVARAFYQFLMARDLSEFTTFSLPPPLDAA